MLWNDTMGHRLTKIYTRTGDKGETGLGDGSRIAKDSPRIEVIGDVDELNSHLGAVLACDIPEPVQECLEDVQHDLFHLGGELSTPGRKAIVAANVSALEEILDGFNAGLPPLKEFILPGGGPGAAACHLARAVCRRAERHMVALARAEAINPQAQRYLNRLSDLLFVLARILVWEAGGTDVLWEPARNS